MLTIPVLIVVALHIIAAVGYSLLTLKMYERSPGKAVVVAVFGAASVVAADWVIGTQLLVASQTTVDYMIGLSGAAAAITVASVFLTFEPEPVEDDEDDDPLNKITRI